MSEAYFKKMSKWLTSSSSLESLAKLFSSCVLLILMQAMMRFDASQQIGILELGVVTFVALISVFRLYKLLLSSDVSARLEVFGIDHEQTIVMYWHQCLISLFILAFVIPMLVSTTPLSELLLASMQVDQTLLHLIVFWVVICTSICAITIFFGDIVYHTKHGDHYLVLKSFRIRVWIAISVILSLVMIIFQILP